MASLPPDALLHPHREVVDDRLAHLAWDALHEVFHRDLQIGYGLRVSAIHCRLRIPPQEKVRRAKVGRMGRPLELGTLRDDSLAELLTEEVQCRLRCVGRCPILLKPYFFSAEAFAAQRSAELLKLSIVRLVDRLQDSLKNRLQR